jgi:hypothetical protein
MLYIDGHGSHVNMRFLTWANEHRILVAVYPPHSTHRLQPLDVSLFSPLANYYSQELNTWLYNTGARIRMTKREFYGLFKPAFRRAMTEKNIESGWKKTGLFPFDPEAVLAKIKIPKPDRPSTSDSESSNSTVYSSSNIRKVRHLSPAALNPFLWPVPIAII